MEGYIKLHRKILDWEWYQNPNMVSVFIHCLLKANYVDKKWQGVEVKRGSFITSYEIMSNELSNRYHKFTTMQVRTSLAHLKATGEITIKSTNRYSVVTVNNYDQYQDDDRQVVGQITNRQQTDNKQITTTKKVKNIKKEKNNTTCESFVNYFNEKFETKFHATKKLEISFNARIKVFDFETLKQSVDRAKESPFYSGENDRGWMVSPQWILKDDENPQKLLNIKKPVTRSNSNPLAVKAIPGKYDNMKVEIINNDE